MYLTSDATVRNILIVDDSAFEQRMLVDLLSEMPYRVSWRSTANRVISSPCRSTPT